MKKFYNPTFSISCKNPIVPDEEEIFSIDEVFPGANLIYSVDMYFAYQGKSVEKWDERNTLLYSDGKSFQDYLPCAIGWPVVSSKVKEVFESLHISNVQFLPVHIKNQRSGELNTDYFVLNILTMIDGVIDLEQTKHRFVEDDDGKSVILISDPQPKVIYSMISQYDVFRILENWPAIYFSETIVNELKARQLTGFDYVEVKTV